MVQTPRGVAVIGEHMWAALKGREAVTVQWDETVAETRGTAEIMAEYRELAAGAPVVDGRAARAAPPRRCRGARRSSRRATSSPISPMRRSSR